MDEKPTVESTGRSPAERLRAALAAMLRQQAGGNPPPALTATTLCRSAGISRTALYRYHPDVLQALREAQQRQRPRPDAAQQAVRQLRRENNELREQLAKLAALVDHYFGAWQESQLLVQRRERELTELRRHGKPQVVPIRP